MPPYYYMKSMILIACGQKEWGTADTYRYAAEVAYAEAHGEAKQHNDADSLELLEEIRDDLDELIDRRNNDIAAHTGIRVYFGSDGVDDLYYEPLEDDDVLSEMEDFDELAEAEDAEEVVAAEQAVLPARTSSPVDEDVKTQDAASSSATPTPTPTPAVPVVPSLAEPASTTRPLTLRAKKSARWNKGGAYNAHQFTKSIGRSAGSGLARLYREWEAEENKSNDRNSDGT
jgi:hypothetical protein